MINQTNIGVNEMETIQILVKQVVSVEQLSITNCDFVNYSQLLQQQSNHLESQQNLNFYGNDYELDLQIIFNKIGEIISDNNNIKNLELHNLKITSQRLRNLLEHLKHSNKGIRVDFSKNLIDDDGFKLLLDYQKVYSDRFQHIILPFNRLSSRVLGMLIDHLRQQNVYPQNNSDHKIQEVVLDGLTDLQTSNVGEFFYTLSQFQPQIVSLSLCNMQITDSVAQTIGYFIKNSLHLEHLNLSFNQLKDNGAQIIIDGAWANHHKFSRLSLLGNYFSKQFSNQIQKMSNKNPQKIQILIEPSLVQSQDSQQNGSNDIHQSNQIRRIPQNGSSLQAINDEDSEMPMVEHSIKHEELFSYNNSNIQNQIYPQQISKIPTLYQQQQQQQQQQPKIQNDSQIVISSNIKSPEQQYQDNYKLQSINQLSQGQIQVKLDDIHNINPNQNGRVSHEIFNETIDFQKESNQKQRSNVDLYKSGGKDNMTFGGNSISHSHHKDYLSSPSMDQVNPKNNQTLSYDNPQQPHQQPNNIEGYIRQIHQIEGHIRDLFERQTQLVDEIKQKISQQPSQILSNNPSHQDLNEQISYRSMPKQSASNSKERKEFLKKTPPNQRPQSFQNLPSEQFFDEGYNKSKTYNGFGQISPNSDFGQQNYNNKSLNGIREQPVKYAENQIRNAQNSHPLSQREFATPETQQQSDNQKVVGSLSALKEQLQELENKLERESHRNLQEKELLSSDVMDYKEPQAVEEKVVKSSKNGLGLYQKRSPSSVLVSSYNEIPIGQQQNIISKTQNTFATIPTENNIDHTQNLNKYSTKYNPQIRMNRHNQDQNPSSTAQYSQNQLKLPNEERDQDRKLSMLSVIQTESHIGMPNISNLRQSREVNNSDNEKVKHSHNNRLPSSQQKQQQQPLVSMVQMEDIAINLNSSPYKQRVNNESRIDQDKEIQQFLNLQQQNFNLALQANNNSQYQQQSSRNESPHKLNSKQRMNVSNHSGVNSPGSQVYTSQSSPQKNGMRNSSIIGNKNLSFSRRRDNVKYLVEELIKLIERYEYLIEMCSELKQIKKKVHDNIGGNYSYNQINNNNLQKLCGVESDIRDKMKIQERQIYESINELREIGLIIDDSKLLNWENLKEVLSGAAIAYEHSHQFGEIGYYQLQDSVIDQNLSNSLYQNTASHKKNPSLYSQTYQLHS